jgi:AcrR family transcriptional regulator
LTKILDGTGMPVGVIGRKRDAAATRAALLSAATSHFAREPYDSVSLRGIAAEAGVDVSLVSRYFGSKEELFVDVLECRPPPEELFEGEPKDFGVRMARMLVDDPLHSDKLDMFLVMLRSASHPAAAEAIRKSSEKVFYGPFARWLGGRNAAERVRLAASIMKGVIIDRHIEDDLGLSPKERERFRARLAKSLQAAVDE